MVEFQKEFFDEFEEKKGRKRKSFRYPKTGQISFSCSFDTLLLGVLLLVMGVVIVYAIGVEVGRREKKQLARKEIVETDRQPIETQDIIVPTEVPVSSPTQKPAKKFTVQIASFRKIAPAEQALEKLKKEKGEIDAYLIPGSNQVAVCVGTYERRSDADRALSELRKYYHDSFVRNR